ncbi:MAG TPA: type II toxin-antitoxin system prevent-host-death family antitoxin [Rhizomicrobium sp.]|jgi:prevent-host-death family protein|nr:type II toxin-antitoxin system prevent-host-death family antitoxin [Rhizomicrobium sp.]
MKVVSITECRKKFEELLAEVEKGEVITVTRYGKPFFDIQQRQKKADAPSAQDAQ